MKILNELDVLLKNIDIKYTKYWSRHPGFFLNKETGETLPVQPCFNGTIFDWYQTLIPLLTQAVAEFMENNSITKKDLEQIQLAIFADESMFIILKNLPNYEKFFDAVDEQAGTILADATFIPKGIFKLNDIGLVLYVSPMSWKRCLAIRDLELKYKNIQLILDVLPKGK